MQTEDNYKVVVPSNLSEQWYALPPREHEGLSKRLNRAAHEANERRQAWPDRAPGIHRGRHRAVVGRHWLLYRQDDLSQTVDVIGFGLLEQHPRRAP
jgi:hypothetical protein